MVDTMQNLLLGSIKTFVRIWKEMSSEAHDFTNLQAAGRIPNKLRKVLLISRQINRKFGL